MVLLLYFVFGHVFWLTSITVLKDDSKTKRWYCISSYWFQNKFYYCQRYVILSIRWLVGWIIYICLSRKSVQPAFLIQPTMQKVGVWDALIQFFWQGWFYISHIYYVVMRYGEHEHNHDSRPLWIFIHIIKNIDSLGYMKKVVSWTFQQDNSVLYSNVRL